MTVGVGGVDGVLDGAGLGGSQEAAFFLNSEEKVPCLLGQIGGELLNEVRTSGNVYHAIEVALVLQQQLLVACDALCELGGSLVGSVEGNHNNAVHTSQSGTHGLGLGAQHVHIAVKQSLVVCGGDGADVHLGAFLAGGILAYNL